MDKRNRLQTHGTCQRSLALLLASLLAVGLPTSVAFAAPEGEQVVEGEASFSRDGSLTTIRAGDNAIINYQGFDILSQETVQFIQPDAAARVLNRVLSADPTQIDGSLIANGQVYIVNPQGVYFGEGAFVDVGALVAAAGNLSNESFLAGADHFENLTGPVENYGEIYGKMVSLIGQHAGNYGSIVAEDGLITLVAGDSVILTRLGDRMGVKLSSGTGLAGHDDAIPGVENAGTLDAGQGVVNMAAGDIYSLALRHTGATRAGTIVLEGGEGGTVEVSGRLDASDLDPGGTGGTIHVLGDRVAVLDGQLDASGDAGGGEILVGGDIQGQGEVRTASRTYVGSEAELRADAVSEGDGGKVIVFGDELARVHGSISARGGAAGGSGGFVETSGADLEVAQAPDLAAPNGSGGRWLIDPNNIEIVGGNGNVDINNTDPFVSTDDGAELGVDLVTGALSNGATVTVTTGTGGTNLEEGDITLTADLDYDGFTGTATLELNAHDDVVINGQVLDGTPGGETLNLVLNADTDSSITGLETGTVSVNNSVDLSGGDFTASGEAFENGGSGTISAGNVQVNTSSATLAADIAATGTISGTATSVTVNAPGSIQDGIDIAAPGPDPGNKSLISVGAGLYEEDLLIDKDNLELAGTPDAVPTNDPLSIIQGVDRVAAAAFPLADPNIDVRGSDVQIHDFTIRGPDPEPGFYASGMVIGGENVEIDHNAFQVPVADSFDDISQGIQSYRDGNNPDATSDLTGLNIHDNRFTGLPDADAVVSGTAGYEGIFINHTTADPTPTGTATIADNSLTGPVIRGITTERSKMSITGNTIETTLVPIDGGPNPGEAFQGILVQDFSARSQDQVTVTGNTVGGDSGTAGSGFTQGIRVGTPGQTVTNVTVTGNTLNGNDLQVQDRVGALVIANVFADNSFDRSVIETGGNTVYSRIQDGIDAATAGETVSVGAGLYEEDLLIDKDNLELAGTPDPVPTNDPLSVIRGVAQPVPNPIPGGLAIPDIDVRGDGAHIHDFTIEGADAEPGRYTSGMVIGGNSVEVNDNAFKVPVADSLADISQGIVTWRDGNNPTPTNDLTGLNIHDNSFEGLPDADAVVSGTAGYEGIFVNHTSNDPTPGAATIADNSMTGPVIRGITTERSNVSITGNTIETTLVPVDGSLDPGEALQGILVRDFSGRDQQDVTVTGNSVGGDAGTTGSGFTAGIQLGGSGQTLTNMNVSGNGTSSVALRAATYDGLALTTDGGAVDGSGDIRLASSLSIDTEQGDDSDAGAVDLSGATVSATAVGLDLEIDASVASASQDGGAVQLGAFDATGGQFLNVLSVDSGSTDSSRSGTVTLHDDIFLDDDGGATAGSFTLSGGGSAVLASSLTIDTEQGIDASGGTVDLQDVMVSAQAAGTDLEIDTSGGAGADGGPVLLGGFDNAGGGFVNDVSVNASDGAGAPSPGGTLTLAGEILLEGVPEGPGGVPAADPADFTFTGDGDVVVAATSKIDTQQSAAVDGGQIDLGASTLSSAPGGFGLTLDASSSAASSKGGDVSFAGADNGAGSVLASLQVDASGTATGGNIALGGDVTTTGDQVYTTTTGGTITTGSTYQNVSGKVEFGGDLVLTDDTVVDAGTDANFLGSVDSDGLGPWALDARSPGTTRFGDGTGDDRVGATNGLSSLTTDDTGATGEKTVFDIDRTGLASGDPSVRTIGRAGINPSDSGNQSYNDAVELLSDTVLAAEAAAGKTPDISFSGTIDTAASASGNRALTVNAPGTTNFSGAVGDDGAGGRPLASLTTDDPSAPAAQRGGRTEFDLAGSTSANPTVKTSGAQTYNDPVLLSADTVLTSTGGNVTFKNVVDARDDANPGTSSRGLTVNTPSGDNRFEGRVGAGAQADSDAQGLKHLITDDGSSGGQTQLAMPGAPSVRTTGEQTYGDDVLLETDIELVSSGGSVTFEGRIDASDDGNGATSSRGLTVNTPLGDNRFEGRVGSGGQAGADAQGLEQLITDASGAGGQTQLAMGGDPSVQTTLEQTYNEEVLLEASAVLTSSDGNVTFRSFVDAADDSGVMPAVSNGTSSSGLTVNTPSTDALSGNTRFDRPVGRANAVGSDPDGLAFLKTDETGGAGGETQLAMGAAGTSVLTTGEQSYGDALAVEESAILESTGNGAITFHGTVNSTAGSRHLEVKTGGVTSFEAPVGAALNGELQTLVTDDQGQTGEKTVLGKSGGTPITVTTKGEQRYEDAVELAQDAELTSTEGGDLRFFATVDTASGEAARSLTLNTAGRTVFHGQLGGTGELQRLVTDDPTAAPAESGGVTFFVVTGSTFEEGDPPVANATVTTTEEQTYNDPVVLAHDTVLVAQNGNAGVTTDVVTFAEDVVAADLLGPDSQALAVVGDSGIRVGGNITASGVHLEVGTGADIQFTGDGQQTVLSRGDIVLDTNRDGLDPADPRNATAGIYKTPPDTPAGNRDLIFDTLVGGSLTGDFEMQPNDKMSVPDGGIGIRASNVTVGDLSAVTIIQIGNNSEPVESLTMHGRPAGYWELPDGTQGTTPGLDNGSELVANGVVIFGTGATVVEKDPNTPIPGVIVGTATGANVGGIIPGRLGEFTLRSVFPSAEGFRPLVTSDFVSEGNNQVPDGAVLDIVARGPGFGPVNVLPYVPTWEEKNPGAQSNKSAVSQRPLREDEVLDFFDCVEQKAGFACEAEVLGAERAESEEAQKVAALASVLFGETQEQRDRRVLEEAALAYRQQTGAGRVDGADFRRFLETTPDQAEALQILDRYGEMLVGLRGLNVTDQAYEAVKLNKLGQIAPQGIDASTLGDAVEAGITAWPTRPGLRIAASDRFYLFRGLETGRVYLLERVGEPPATAQE